MKSYMTKFNVQSWKVLFKQTTDMNYYIHLEKFLFYIENCHILPTYY